MRNRNIYLVSFVLSGLFTFSSSAFEKRKCLISNLDVVCPPFSHCLEQDGPNGACVCMAGYIFNALYTNDQDYCFLDHTTPALLPAAISVSGQSAAATDTIPHHHIISGILIPLVLVASFVGVAYVMVRYRVLQRIRDKAMGRRRRHRPTYHMGSGTEFDPPLI